MTPPVVIPEHESWLVGESENGEMALEKLLVFFQASNGDKRPQSDIPVNNHRLKPVVVHKVDHSTNVVVHVTDQAGINLHCPGLERRFLVTEGIPVPCDGVQLCRLCVSREYSCSPGTLSPSCFKPCESVVILSPVLAKPWFGHMQPIVYRGKPQVSKKRFSVAPIIPNHIHQGVGVGVAARGVEILGQTF